MASMFGSTQGRIQDETMSKIHIGVRKNFQVPFLRWGVLGPFRVIDPSQTPEISGSLSGHIWGQKGDFLAQNGHLERYKALKNHCSPMITFKPDHKFFGDSSVNFNEKSLGSHSKYPKLSKKLQNFFSKPNFIQGIILGCQKTQRLALYYSEASE